MAITAAELLVRVGADTSDAESGLKSFSSKMSNIAGGMGAVGGILSAAVAAPLIGIGVSAVKTAADFERSMNVLGYASGATADQMQALSDQALQLGADTVFSANEAAEGMVELSKAGMDVTDVMDAIPGVMDLAAAGQISVSEAATLAAATVNTFGLEASKTTEVADILAAAANASAADITDLAFGVQNAGSVFATSGQSVQTLATMMALLANNGLNASDAATSLKTMTMRLTAPTAAAAKQMKSLGIAVFNADGSMRDYHDIVGDIERATIGLSDAQRSAAFTTIFGADAIRAANIMAAEGTAGYEAMATAVGEQGAAAAMAGAQNSGLAGAMEQISGSVESLMTKLALPFLPTIAGWISGITDFVNGLGTLSPAVINATLAFGGFAIALSALLLAGAGIAGVIGALATPVGLVTLVVIGLAAAVAGLWLAWQTNWMNIQGLTATAIGAINPLLETLGTALSNASSYLASTAASVALLLALNPQWQGFVQGVKDAAAALSDLATHPGSIATNVAALLALNPQWQGFVQNVKDAAAAVSGFATSLATGAISFAVLLALNPQWQGFIANVQSAAAAVAALATNMADAVVNFKLPDLKAGLQTLKSNVELQVNASVKTLLKPPTLTVAPFPPMTIPPPIVKITPIAEQTLAAPVIKTAAAGPGKMIDSLTATIEGGDWAGVGRIMGSLIIANWNAEVAKIGPMLSFVGLLNTFGQAWNTFQSNFILGLLGFGIAIGATGLPEKIAALGTAIGTAVTTMWTSLMATIMGAIMKPPPDASSAADVLRDRALGTDFKWDIPKLVWADWIDANNWDTWIVALSWTTFVGMLTWTTFVSALAWTAFISALGWNSYVPELSWGAWINPLNWGDFISWLAIPSSGGGGSSGGSLQDQPQHLNPNDPRPQGFSFGGPEVAAAGFGGDGGITINVNVASVNNGMDVEQLAAQLARRFQQKLRL